MHPKPLLAFLETTPSLQTGQDLEVEVSLHKSLRSSSMALVCLVVMWLNWMEEEYI